MSEQCCERCDDGDGNCRYPYYGLAPHSHNMYKTGSIIGSTEIQSKDQWPANFTEDKDCEGCGTYTHCPHCGKPRMSVV